MSTSQHQRVALYDPAALEGGEPVDATFVRDELIDSTQHKADEAAQPVMSWMQIAGRDPLRPVSEEGIENWMPFPIRGGYNPRVKANGEGYRLRIRLLVAREAGSSPGPVSFAVTVGPAGIGPADIHRRDTVTVTDVGVTSNTPVWSSIRYLDIPASIIAEARLRQSPIVTNVDLGGRTVTVQPPHLEVIVSGRALSGNSTPVLWGVHVAEFIGP